MIRVYSQTKCYNFKGVLIVPSGKWRAYRDVLHVRHNLIDYTINKLCSLFTWSRRTTVPKDRGLFLILITHKSTRPGSPITWLCIDYRESLVQKRRQKCFKWWTIFSWRTNWTGVLTNSPEEWNENSGELRQNEGGMECCVRRAALMRDKEL